MPHHRRGRLCLGSAVSEIRGGERCDPSPCRMHGHVSAWKGQPAPSLDRSLLYLKHHSHHDVSNQQNASSPSRPSLPWLRRLGDPRWRALRPQSVQDAWTWISLDGSAGSVPGQQCAVLETSPPPRRIQPLKCLVTIKAVSASAAPSRCFVGASAATPAHAPGTNMRQRGWISPCCNGG